MNQTHSLQNRYLFLTFPAIVGTLNDLDELPGMARLVGDMLNRSGSATYPENEFAEIINSHLPVSVQLYDNNFPRTEEDKKLFSFEINASCLSPALEM